MRIAVISDVHDDIGKFSSVLDKIKEEECEMVFALGDYTSPEIFKDLVKADVPVYAVFGNMDQDHDIVESWARKSGKNTKSLGKMQIRENGCGKELTPVTASRRIDQSRG